MQNLVEILNGTIAATLENVQRSLVIVQGRRFGAGAGVIWRADGLILTNNHVVNDHNPLVILSDGQKYEARLVARDPEIDMAILHIPAANLPIAVPADSRNVRIGELAFAVGHPWGQRGYVTAGIISAILTVQTRRTRRWLPVIRTDAALAPGNSGGPLVNAAGQVLGLNTMIVGGDQGVAVPIHIAEAFMAEAAKTAEAGKFFTKTQTRV